MAEYLTGVSTGQGDAPLPTPGTTVTPDSLNQMMNVLESLLSHTHVFYDDYGTACNCNCACNCQCTRGSL